MNNQLSNLGKKRFTTSKLAALVFAGILATSSVTANAAWGGHHGGNHRGGDQMLKHFEKLGDILDLSGEQMDKVHDILNKAKADAETHKGDRIKMRKTMMALNPDDADYIDRADASAETQAAKMKEKMHKMALVRQQIHAVLTDEQKQELTRMTERRMKRMEKRWGNKNAS